MDLRVVGRAVPGEPEPARPPGWDGGAQSGIKEKQCTSCSQESVRARVALFPACVLKTLSPAGHLRDYLITLNPPPPSPRPQRELLPSRLTRARPQTPGGAVTKPWAAAETPASGSFSVVSKTAHLSDNKGKTKEAASSSTKLSGFPLQSLVSRSVRSGVGGAHSPSSRRRPQTRPKR